MAGVQIPAWPGIFSHKDSWPSGLFVYCSFVLNIPVYDGCFFLHFLIFNTHEEALYLPETLIVIMQICF